MVSQKNFLPIFTALNFFINKIVLCMTPPNTHRREEVLSLYYKSSHCNKYFSSKHDFIVKQKYTHGKNTGKFKEALSLYMQPILISVFLQNILLF